MAHAGYSLSVSRPQRSTSRAYTPVFAGYGGALQTRDRFGPWPDQQCHSASKTRVKALMASLALALHRIRDTLVYDREENDMRKDCTIGLVVPFASDTVPEEGLQMYPGVRFVARGVGVRSLTPTGYDSAWEGILPAAEHLAGLGVDAVMVIGTSLTFYRGADAHDELMAKLRAATGLPVSTMSQAVVDGLRSFGARQIAVATAYADEVNDRLQAFLIAKGFEVLSLEGFGLFGFGEPDTKSEADIIALGSKVCAAAPAADGLLISCGGLRTLGVAKPLEQRHDIPVVASTQAAFWAALRLVGDSCRVAGRGRLLEQSTAAPVH
jgi:arylmalonate decarboxylase